MVALNFNPAGIVPQFEYGGGTLWTNGWKQVMISKSDVRDNNDKSTGQHLGLTLKCLQSQEPTEVNTEAYLAVNLFNAKAATKAQAEAQLTAILWVLGIHRALNATEELHNIPFWVENQQRKYTPPGGTERLSNNFVGIRNMNGVEPGKETMQQAGGPGGAPQMTQAPQPVYTPQPQPTAPAYQPPAAPQPQYQPQPQPAYQPPAPAAATPAPSWAPPGAPAPGGAAPMPGGQPSWAPPGAR